MIIMIMRFGEENSSAFLKAHVITGCDVITGSVRSYVNL